METNGGVPPCIQIPSQFTIVQYDREIKIATRQRIISLLVATGILALCNINAFIISMTLVSIMASMVCCLTTAGMEVVLIITFKSYFTIRVPSGAHVCDLRVAVAQKLNVDPTHLEISTLSGVHSDNEAIQYEACITEYYYTITEDLARGIIPELYS